MSKTSHETGPAGAAQPAAGAAWGPVVVVLASLAGAWIAAGATGLWAHPLRRVLVWVAMGVVLLSDWPNQSRLPRHLLALKIGAILAIVMAASNEAAINVLAVGVLLCAVSYGRSGAARRTMLPAAMAVCALGLYRVAVGTIPTVWTATDRLGRLIGVLGGAVSGRPVWLGATFAGLDFLVLMGVLYAGWLLTRPEPRLRRGLFAAAAILLGHLAYLAVLAYAPDLLEAIPKPDGEPGWSWSGALRTLVPWNLPVLAGLIHLCIAAAMLRWSGPPEDAPRAEEAAGRWLRLPAPALWGIAAGLAVLLPVLTTLPVGQCSLEGKKVVAYEEGYLNWLKPEHGDYGYYSIGMYGMLGRYVESLGGRWLKSKELSADDLAGADILILLYPDKVWTAEQKERIFRFVREGGSLLVMGEHTIRDREEGTTDDSRFNEILEPTNMRVRFDSGMFEVGGWLHSYQTVGHPTTAGLTDDRNEFGVVIGGSVDAPWPARPLLVGRWGWQDYGDEGAGEAKMGDRRYEPGEKLGDLVLAAERPMGRGTVVAFGDTSHMTNRITTGVHPYTSRLLAYLGGRPGTGHAMWRQLAGILLAGALAFVAVSGMDPLRLATAAIVLGATLHVCVLWSHRLTEVFPSDGPDRAKSNLAYVDSTHMGHYSETSWNDNGTGIGGLEHTLIRNGYLVLSLPEFTAERLAGAGLLVSPAPLREFTGKELDVLEDFIRGGGIFICTVGNERPEAARSLLKRFGFGIGYGPRETEPLPMGHFKAPYYPVGGRMLWVRFHAAWPIWGLDAKPTAYGRGYGRPDEPSVILRKTIGLGKIVVIGDAYFATDQNLERKDGKPIEGLRENADFWRWLFTILREQKVWPQPEDLPDPPAPPVPATAPASTQPAGAGGEEAAR